MLAIFAEMQSCSSTSCGLAHAAALSMLVCMDMHKPRVRTAVSSGFCPTHPDLFAVVAILCSWRWQRLR